MSSQLCVEEIIFQKIIFGKFVKTQRFALKLAWFDFQYKFLFNFMYSCILNGSIHKSKMQETVNISCSQVISKVTMH